MPVQKQIEDILNKFTSISLKEMDSVELMNRTDSKYIFNLMQLPGILEESKDYFKVLQINQERLFSYHTIYYDTCDYDLFNYHMQGKLNRHKIRHRTYESTGVSYLEVKFKSNKNRTIKWRIKNEVRDSFDKKATEFLMDRTKMGPEKLNPVVVNNFTRITLVSIEDKMRITLDFNLSFRGTGKLDQELPFLAIAEIKQDGCDHNNPFVKLLRKRGIRQSGFSKYCMGSALLYDIPHKNILKPKFLQLKRIEKEYDINTLTS